MKWCRTYSFHQNYYDQINPNLGDLGDKLNVNQEYDLVVMKVNHTLRYEECPRKLDLLSLGQQKLKVGSKSYLLLQKQIKRQIPFRWQGTMKASFSKENSDWIFRNMFTPEGASALNKCPEKLWNPHFFTSGQGPEWPALTVKFGLL